MQNHLVSVIMPMYNAERFVAEAVRSVLSQTYTTWELLIVDDGSTDRSVEIAQSFEKSDARIRVLFNDCHNQMPSGPRNYGLRHAQGQYIAFLDSDDCWLPQKLQHQLPLFSDAGVSVVYSDYEKIDEEGTRRHRVVRAPRSVDYVKMLKSNYIGNLTGIYDRAKVGTVGIPEIHHEDYAMWLAILKKGGRAVNTNTVEGLYRIRNSSVSSHKMSLLLWQWQVYRQLEHLSPLKSLYYYFHYAVRGYLKSRI